VTGRRIHVFAGPSVSHDRVRELLPQATVHGPVAHLDVLRLPIEAGDIVAVIDGVFLQSAPVRHKELLHLLDVGAEVWGAASMGALRAAELAPFGMRGSGLVWKLYATGVLERDDEVAVVHADADGRYRPLSFALVSIRVAARCARRLGLVDRDVERALVAAADALLFPQRMLTPIVRGAVEAGADPRQCDAFAQYARDPQHDVKRQDAERLLCILAERVHAPARSQACAPRRPTVFFDRWLEQTSGADVDGVHVADASALAFCRLFADDYPDLHRRLALSDIAGMALSSPLDELLDAALAVAAERGIASPGTGGIAPAMAVWLTPAERREPPADAIVRVLVRSCRRHPAQDLLEPALAALRGTPAFRNAQRHAARALQLNAAHAERDERFTPEHISEARVRAFLSERWGIADDADELEAAAQDRGFTDTRHLLRFARPLLPYGVLHAPERFRVSDVRA
jgi:hypothetical protein